MVRMSTEGSGTPLFEMRSNTARLDLVNALTSEKRCCRVGKASRLGSRAVRKAVARKD